MVRTLVGAIAILALTNAGVGCSSFKTAMGVSSGRTSDVKPIRSPFGDYKPSDTPKENMVFRTKHGDGAIEVEIPRSSQDNTDFVIPVASQIAPAGRAGGRAPASMPDMDESGQPRVDGSYRERAPTITDREITRAFPQGAPEDDGRRLAIESDLGLMAPEESTPQQEKSYLASIDGVKQLYKAGRYEAALIEVDTLITQYQTNPRLYQMRGTLLDRVGQPELALKAWKQALRLQPGNRSLRRFIERREERAGLSKAAGP